MLDCSDRTRTGISILTSAADNAKLLLKANFEFFKVFSYRASSILCAANAASQTNATRAENM